MRIQIETRKRELTISSPVGKLSLPNPKPTPSSKSEARTEVKPTSSIIAAIINHHEKIMSSGVKRDRDGNARVKGPGGYKQQHPRGKFHVMFEGFRDELDEHHDRRERIVKASRDVTAQSKKM